ncbi:tetraprenyl-beta-curcumene synthase family protein [Bacillus sp. 2205SS5-2]|uniref:tetraprenyl-beta-curcumene synthase family protein n=1 Tax=Bacillus sp. 2205SS5-2 TaxID=3109031 RepID=UPI0030060650
MSVPVTPIPLMANVYRKVFPMVHKELNYWKERASLIPDDELRKQAVQSIKGKTFHCEGGAILALLAGNRMEEAIKFIVAYQTISDYLDNLCDRSTSLDPDDFSALHESMNDCLSIEETPKDYYRLRKSQGDLHYLRDLVVTCQNVLKRISPYEEIRPYLLELCHYYCDLQIHKHVCVEEREERLRSWFQVHQPSLPTMDWHEFSACSGSTLGIFCLVSYSLREDFRSEYGEMVRNGYFPYIQGLHILLDYFIDQEEDLEEGDLNFCFYYQDNQQLFERLQHFLSQADEQTKNLPHREFHRLINRGLLGVYLSDEKVTQQREVNALAKKIIKQSGFISRFFYANGRVYRKYQNSFLGRANRL